MRHDAAGSWLRALAGPGSARTHQSLAGLGQAGARGAALRIDFGCLFAIGALKTTNGRIYGGDLCNVKT